MDRKATADLVQWKDEINRKPLIIRGARQVGKTYLIRDFAKNHFENFIEINLDKNPELGQLFEDRNIDKCLKLLEIETGIDITPGKTLLFLDEIQAVPHMLPLMRYFYEDRPDIHLIAAGSLLEFLLAEHSFSMPVGRIEYLHLGPLDINEFLVALGENKLSTYLNTFSLNDSIPASIHNSLMFFVQLFWIIGGMPAAIKRYAEAENISATLKEHASILQTYEDDFSKYRKKINPLLLRKVFQRLPALVGKKLKYVNIDRGEKARDLAHNLDLLELARVLYSVRHSAGNGIPLGAETKEKDFKPLFLDVGLMTSSLGLSLSGFQMESDILLVNNGSVAEQFIGQHLLYRQKSYQKPELYYWNREQRNSQAEVDYLISHEGRVVPVEVKAGKTGSLKSLQVFVSEKRAPVAVRFCSLPPSCFVTQSSIAQTETMTFSLISLPLYLVGQVNRLLEEWTAR